MANGEEHDAPPLSAYFDDLSNQLYSFLLERKYKTEEFQPLYRLDA